MVSYKQAIRRFELLERAAQGGVGCGLAVTYEVASDEDQRRVAVVRVDIGDRRLKARVRIKTVEQRARRCQVGIGEVDDLRHARDYQEFRVSPERLTLFMPLPG